MSLVMACDGGDKPAENDAMLPPIDAAVPDAKIPCSDDDPAAAIAALPGIVSVDSAECGGFVPDGARCYWASLSQPVKGDDAASGTYSQRIRVVHVSCDLPTVLNTQGYELGDQFYVGELATYFNANWMDVEHHFQGGSAPSDDIWAWDGLTIHEGAEDTHRLIQTLSGYYDGRWITTGASKGGITAIYHRYLYPDDVAGTVPYVAPASLARIDPRYQTYMDTMGPEVCRTELRAFQVRVLSDRRTFMANRLDTELGGGDPAYADEWLEQATKSFDWAFWQYFGTDYCASVPNAKASDADHWAFWASLNGFSPEAGGVGTPGNATPDNYRNYQALYYEWLTQQGFALQIGAHLQPHLVHPHQTLEDWFNETAPVTLPPYDSSVTVAAIAYASTQATNMVMIYGANDPWTGGQLDAPTGDNSGKFTAPTAGHWASIGELSESDRTAALSLLSEIFGQTPMVATRSRLSPRVTERKRRDAMMRVDRARRLRLIKRKLSAKYAK